MLEGREMKLATTCMVLAGCLGILPLASAGSGWRSVGAVGDRHFVVVDAAAADNTAVYRDAATTLCKPARTCVVMYWNDERLAASKMPLSTAQAQSLAAQFTRSPTSGNERLLLRCRGGEPSGSCLK